ncbi:MAG: hypothetical protein AAGA80_06170 [Cyanobacteria bacterium P01_F01_bin.143]
MKNRLIEIRRQEIADNAKQIISAFQRGELTPQTADKVIAQLQKSLQDN